MKKIIKHIIIILVALVVLFEEWLWDHLLKLMSWIGKLPIFKQLEYIITKFPPKLALLVFILPALALLPFKLLAIKLFAQHHILLGGLTYVAAKIVGTALVARLFQLTRPALMELSWFAKNFEKFINWKNRLYAYLKASRGWEQVTHFKHTIKRFVSRFKPHSQKPSRLNRLWRAAKKLKQRQRN